MTSLTRFRTNFIYGTMNAYNSSQTTITGTATQGVIISSPGANQYLPIILNPGYYGSTVSGEIVWATSIVSQGSNYVFTLAGRGQEGTTAVSGANNTPWIAGPLISDFGFNNQLFNGDFPAPTTSGQIFISTNTTITGYIDSAQTQPNLVTYSGQFSSTLPPNFIINPSINLSGTLNHVTLVPNGNILYAVNQQTGTSYTAASGDSSTLILMSNSSQATVTIPYDPTNSLFTVGQQITIIRDSSSANVVVSGASGVTLFSAGSISATPTIRSAGSSATAICLAANKWVVAGDLA
jgi:hypothetical protein